MHTVNLLLQLLHHIGHHHHHHHPIGLQEYDTSGWYLGASLWLSIPSNLWLLDLQMDVFATQYPVLLWQTQWDVLTSVWQWVDYGMCSSLRCNIKSLSLNKKDTAIDMSPMCFGVSLPPPERSASLNTLIVGRSIVYNTLNTCYNYSWFLTGCSVQWVGPLVFLYLASHWCVDSAVVDGNIRHVLGSLLSS